MDSSLALIYVSVHSSSLFLINKRDSIMHFGLVRSGLGFGKPHPQIPKMLWEISTSTYPWRLAGWRLATDAATFSEININQSLVALNEELMIKFPDSSESYRMVVPPDLCVPTPSIPNPSRSVFLVASEMRIPHGT